MPPHLSNSGSNRGGGGLQPPSGSANITPPQGAFFNPAAWYNLLPFPVASSTICVALPAPPQRWPNFPGHPSPEVTTAGDTITTAGDVDDNEDGEESGNESAGSDAISLLTDKEAIQFRELSVFDPTVKDETSWQYPVIMRRYLEMNFDQRGTQKDPQRLPNASLQAPTLDPEVKDQI